MTATIVVTPARHLPGSGYERYTKTRSGDDAKFVVVEAHAANNRTTSTFYASHRADQRPVGIP